ncbi:anti-sigma factor [Pseudolysinimonas sp.]|uniref:anti-sigma factor n=1 Tax=Pseudolysinimonas sp. TaxID=2680009 RepID=UPI003F812BBA
MSATDDRELAAGSGAYALHALDGQEAEDFAALLERSPGIRAEVTELADTAVELGLAVPTEQPSAALRSRILAAVASTPQLTAVDADDDAARSDEESGGGDLAPVTPISWFRRPVGALTTAAAAVLLAVGAAAGGGAIQSAVAASQVSAIASAPDADHATARLAGGGTARVVWSDELGRAAVQLDGAPAPGLDRTYQLWYMHGGTARSAGTIADSRDVVLSGRMHPGDTIGITVEPAGGSAVPTSAPLLAMPTA